MRFLLILLAGLACIPSPALAWGYDGHRIMVTIADEHLSGLARAEIGFILEGQSRADVSIWADEMRDDPDAFWQVTAPPYHYVIVPAGKVYADVGAPPEGDAYNALALFAATLRNPAASVEPLSVIADPVAQRVMVDIALPGTHDRAADPISASPASHQECVFRSNHRSWQSLARRDREASS